jgi:hypothetical protein
MNFSRHSEPRERDRLHRMRSSLSAWSTFKPQEPSALMCRRYYSPPVIDQICALLRRMLG